MNHKKIEISYQLFDNVQALSDENQHLVKLAYEALENAYSVYSEFSVGAAILLESGEIITANNQENIAYPSGLCAERVGMYYAKSQYPDAVFKKIAIMAKSKNGELKEVISPCGACRQSMNEYERIQQGDIEVIFKGLDDEIIIFNSVKDLLPFSFETKVL